MSPQGGLSDFYESSPFAAERDKHMDQDRKTSGECERYLHRHDLLTGHMPHLLHHPVRPPAQLHDGLQVIRLHLKVLQERKARVQ